MRAPKTLVSRRTVLASAMAGVLTVSAPRALMAQGSTPETGEWSFTDDKGVTVTLPTRPTRIAIDVNAAAPLWDFGIVPSALFGWNVLADGSLGDAGGSIEPQGIPVVGNVNEPMIVEDLVASDPELVVTLTWTPDDPQDYWSIDPEILDQVQAIAPIVALSATGMADANTLRFAELAEALGADLATPELAEAEQAFTAAIEAFKSIAAEKSDLVALFIAPVSDNTWVASPADWADLNMYMAFGLNIVAPDVEPGAFWENISHEQALKYPADVVFHSTRGEALTAEDITASPTWGLHPAIAAGQLYPWNQDFIMSYQGMTQALNELADNLTGATKTLDA